MLEQSPEWLLFVGLVGAVFLAVQAGIVVGVRYGKSRMRPGDEEGIGNVVGGVLGLLAFMLAFTFGIAANRRDSRKALLLEEVNSIGTTYLRAGLIPEPHGQESRTLLRKYVDLRLTGAEHPEELASVVAESEKIHALLWRHAEALADLDLKNADIVSLYVDSLNQTIDLHTSRRTVYSYRIPTAVWIVFGILTAVATSAVGYHFGIHSESKRLLMSLTLAVSFAAVTVLILDLDRGQQGWLRIDQEPMYDLQRQMRE